jgi:uncharacterized protein with NRDE domain
VAANRDEYFDRPAEGLRVRDLEGAPGQRILSPLDLRAGGTWLGMNAEGVFAAVTNLRDPNPDPRRRSRGLLVMDALRAPTATRAADWLKALSQQEYNPFHCFVADRDRAFHTTYRNTARQRELEPGVHVLGNVDPSEEPAPKADRVRTQVGDCVSLPREQVWEKLAGVCRQHETGDLGDVCVHLEEYGTRSSALLMLTEEKIGSRLAYSHGPPCQNDYQDYSTLLSELSQTASYDSGKIATRSPS